MKITQVGLLVLLAGSICPPLSSQSAEKPEAKQQPQAAPKPKDESSSQMPAPEAFRATGEVEILSDTMGFDFGPYLKRVFYTIKYNWNQLVPDSARAPNFKQGRVVIEFAILKDGKTAGLKRISSSGDVALDRAAWGGITNSPFAALPAKFHGQYLQLRCKFFYNQAETEDGPDPRPADKVAPAEKKPEQ